MKFSRSFSANTPHDLATCGVGALLLEVATWPKPGNVHRTKDFHDTRFEHFLMGDLATYAGFLDLASNPEIPLGASVLSTVSRVGAWQTGGNVNLGQVLLFTPLVAGAKKLLSATDKSIGAFRKAVSEVIASGDPEDSANIVEAVRLARMGGLRAGAKFDVNSEGTIREIREKSICPVALFEPTAYFDSISYEWTSKFEKTFTFTYPLLVEKLEAFEDFNSALLLTFLEILGTIPDSLIWRKAGEGAALEVSKAARSRLDLAIEAYGKRKKINGVLEIAGQFDRELQEKGGKYNPGTTADLLAAAIFVALLYGLRP
ncbi:MAG: triphosphoribosyl-dephospho-CoA synthase [Promethearchaeota archaeon]